MSNICWLSFVEDSKKRSRDDEVVEKKDESKSSKKMRKSGNTSSLTLYFSSYDHDNNVRGSKGYVIM